MTTTLKNLTLEQLEQQLNNLKTEKEQLIKNYYIINSEDMLYNIIDLGKKIGTLTYEINYKKVFKK